jgi:hypothetical protein
MKIIGKGKNNFILEASRVELANLIGFYSKYDVLHLKVGIDIKVHQMYEQLFKLSRFKEEMDAMSANLSGFAEALKQPLPVDIDCPTGMEGD